MIYTDGKPTICSENTQIRDFGIKNYSTEIVSHEKESDKEDNDSVLFTNTNKAVAKMAKTKREQLAVAFKKILSDFTLDTTKTHFINLDEHCLLIDVDRLTNKLLYEVSTRVYIGGE